MCSIEKYEQELKLHGKSNNTINAYSLQFTRFLEYFNDSDIRYLSIDEIKEYILLLHDVFGYSATSLANIISASAKRAKINKNVHPQTLRHSFASYLVSININLKKIQDWLGHANIKTTEQYCHIEKENNPIRIAS